MLDRLDETIVAVSSPPGRSPLGIVRISGPRAISIAEQMTRMDDKTRLGDRRGSTRSPGTLLIDNDGVLPVHVYLFRRPFSYTRQDLVELHTIGSAAVLDLIRECAIALGARRADAGEFTARAFLNGGMDLATAEAVAGVIRAESDVQLRAARRMKDGSLAKCLLEVRTELAELTALVEADIDFAEEPIEFITPAQLCERLDSIRARLSSLLVAARSSEQFDTVPHVLLLGVPNAGKSSLLNALSGTRRAICAAVAGTTRDILSAPARLGNTEVVLLDSAGVDKTADGILAQARAMTLATAERVDLACIVVDIAATDAMPLEEFHSRELPPTVIAANKCDLLAPAKVTEVTSWLSETGSGPVVGISALTGQGLDELGCVIRSVLGDQTTTTFGEAVLISRRQRSVIDRAVASLTRAADLAASAADTVDCADLVAFELREALEALGMVTGEVTTEDLLGQVFANFCIGK